MKLNACFHGVFSSYEMCIPQSETCTNQSCSNCLVLTLCNVSNLTEDISNDQSSELCLVADVLLVLLNNKTKEAPL